MIQFTINSPVLVTPLGSDVIFRPQTSDDLWRYLNNQLDAWKNFNLKGQSSLAVNLVISEQVSKVQSSFSYVSAQLSAPDSISPEIISRELQDYFLDVNNVWMDPSSEDVQSYLEKIRDGITGERDLRQLRIRMIRKRTALLNGNTPQSSLHRIRYKANAKDEDEVLSSKYEELERRARQYWDSLKQEASEEINTAVERVNLDEGELSLRIKSSLEELNNLHDLMRTHRVGLAKINEDYAYVKAELEKSREIQSGALDDLRNALASARSNLDAEISVLKASIEGATTEGLAKLTELTQGTELARGQASAELDAFKARYEEKARLHLPTEYWAQKGTRHFSVAILAFVVFVCAILGTGYLALEHFSPLWDHLKELQTNSAGALISVTGLAVVTIPAVAFFWILKHISRVFVENLAQSNDAGQRRVMMQTYLALVGDPTAKVSDQERLLVLNALFRPSVSHGSDDAPPSNLLDILKQIGDAKKDGK